MQRQWFKYDHCINCFSCFSCGANAAQRFNWCSNELNNYNTYFLPLFFTFDSLCHVWFNLYLATSYGSKYIYSSHRLRAFLDHNCHFWQRQRHDVSWNVKSNFRIAQRQQPTPTEPTTDRSTEQLARRRRTRKFRTSFHPSECCFSVISSDLVFSQT